MILLLDISDETLNGLALVAQRERQLVGYSCCPKQRMQAFAASAPLSETLTGRNG